MKIVKTIRLKLDVEVAKLLPTIHAYTNSFNYVSKIGFENKKSHSIDLHNLTYAFVRENLRLPSQLTCSSRNKASEALNGLKTKKIRNCPVSKQQSIRYDRNSFTLNLAKNFVSLLTIDGRLKCPIILSNYHKEYFLNWKYSSAELIIKKKTQAFLHISFEQDISDTLPNGNFVGLDRGISNIAVTSNNKFYTGKHVKRAYYRYKNLRKKLQEVNTKSAKRHLRKLSSKEKRFKAEVNHIISKRIVQNLNPGDTLLLENLKGIRNQRLRKTVRCLVNQWSFHQLEQFLQYKANIKGIRIEHVVAKYTSQVCSKCGHCERKNRKTQSIFRCKECGYSINADLNASRNIRTKGLISYKEISWVEVNQPKVSA